MPRRAIVAILVAAGIGLAPVAATAQLLPGDHRIVPGVRIGAAEPRQIRARVIRK